MTTFIAKCITCQNDNGLVMVAFADDDVETTKYLLFQRTLEPDEQDRELGQDKVHVQLDSQEQSGYGGVSALRLNESIVTIEFDASMAQVLGTSAVEIQLEADVDRALLREHLSLVMGDEPTLQIK